MAEIGKILFPIFVSVKFTLTIFFLSKVQFGREKPLTEQVKAVIYPEMKQKLKELAKERQCTVPDLIRDALEQYLNAVA